MRSILTSLLLVGACGAASAQTTMMWKTDSAVMGNGYANDVFRKLDNNYSDSAVNNNWTLGFQMIPQGGPSSNVAIFVNHVRQGVKVYSLHKQASMMFDSLSANDTVGLTSTPLYNSDQTWATGALNQMADSTNPFDFSWGTYNMTTHNVTGDSLYLLKTNSGDYKLWVKEYVSMPVASIRYTFRIAKFDGTGDTTVDLYRQNGFTNALLGYYNVVDGTTPNREPNRNNWQLLFTRYVERISQGGITAMYNVTGVLQNIGVSMAEVINADADSAAAGYLGYTYSNNISTIGSDWKTYNNATQMWTIDTAKNYFMKSDTTISGTVEYYHIRFMGFGGTATGKTFYQYRKLTPLSVSNVEEPVNAFMLAPNPASSETQILLDVKRSETARLLVTDAMGRTIQNSMLQLNAGLNGYAVSMANAVAGNYFVTVTGNGWTKTAQLLIQK